MRSTPVATGQFDSSGTSDWSSAAPAFNPLENRKNKFYELEYGARPGSKPEKSVGFALYLTDPKFGDEFPVRLSDQASRPAHDAARNSGQANMVDFGFPEIPHWLEAKKIVDSGGVGKIHQINITWNVETRANLHRVLNWKTTEKQGGGTLLNFVSHVFYYLEWIAGPVLWISGNLFNIPDDDRPGDKFSVVTLQFESGAAASISVGTSAFLGGGHRLELYGNRGSLLLENTTADYMRGFELRHGTRDDGELKSVAVENPKDFPDVDGRILPVSRLVGRFLDWIVTGTVEHPNFGDGLRVQKLIDAAERSNNEGRRIDLRRAIQP